MSTNEDLQGVSNCYVFKSRLQEYAQKAGLHTPVYETVKEGPSHEPSFRSTVTLNDVRYDSLSGFFNRKAAEQSAAEVALVELAKSGEVNQSITQPVHETGLCKNLLQEYAQKMNYAMPMYICKKDETPGRTPFFSCTVDIGGIHYIGGSAKTKKEAEIKAARTALLAIQSNPSHASENQVGNLTVIPCKKRAAESVARADETSNAPKPKKARFKRKYSKRKFSRNKKGRINADNAGSEANINNGVESQVTVTDESGLQEIKSEAAFPSEAMKNFENGVSSADLEKETLVGEGSFAQKSQGVSENGNSQSIVTDESGLQEIKSEAAFPAEAIKNFENGASIADHEKETVVGEGSFAQKSQGVSENGISRATVTDESGLQEIKSEAAFPSEVIKNFENGASIADHEKETSVGVGSFAQKSQGVSENGNSQATVTDESGLQEIKSEAAFPSEAIKNFENGVSTADHEEETLVREGSFAQKNQGVSENGNSQATVTDESGLQETKSEAAFPSEAIKNFENGVSTADHEKETLVGEDSFAQRSQGVSENGNSQATVTDESGLQETKSEAAFPSEAIKNFENGVSTADHEKETLVGEDSFAQRSQGVSENGNSQATVTDESGLQETKSEAAFPSEAIKNFENGVSTDPEKETLVGEGSFALKSQGVSENGKSTELVFKEDNIVTVAAETSSVPNGDTNGRGDEQTAVPMET